MSAMSPVHVVNEGWSLTPPMPCEGGSKFSQNGSSSTTLPTSTSTSQTRPKARLPAADESVAHAATASTRMPAASGYDHELIAYSAPSDSAAASASATDRSATSPRGPAIPTCSANASASSVNGSARTCAWTSPSVNENAGNSLIVSLITREGANQS